MEEELSDDDINMLIGLGIVPEAGKSLEAQLATAQQLRQDAMNGPEMRGNVRVQTAANPLEFLAKGVQGYRAGKDIKDIQGKQDELLGQTTAGRKAFFDALRRKKSMPSGIQDIGFDPDSIQAPNLHVTNYGN